MLNHFSIHCWFSALPPPQILFGMGENFTAREISACSWNYEGRLAHLML
uniref:Uncharacterized protein n=1 Tax=Rhizophora mucronata TaxID=61149 RepID=A0A2P2PA76_RHIMU